MQRHDACSRGKRGQGLDPHRVWGDPSSARRPPVGGCGSPPRWHRQPVKKERGCAGEEGLGVHAGRGGGGVGRFAGARARGRGCGVLSRERHRSLDREGGAAAAGQSWPGIPGRPRHLGPRSAEGPAPRSAERIPPSIIHGGESWWRRGEAPRRPLAAEPDRDGPRRMGFEV